LNHPLHNRTLHISGTFKKIEKPYIETEKPDIETEKPDIDLQKANIGEEKVNIDLQKVNIEDKTYGRRKTWKNQYAN
jgi:hypothetical protein